MPDCNRGPCLLVMPGSALKLTLPSTAATAGSHWPRDLAGSRAAEFLRTRRRSPVVETGADLRPHRHGHCHRRAENSEWDVQFLCRRAQASVGSRRIAEGERAASDQAPDEPSDAVRSRVGSQGSGFTGLSPRRRSAAARSGVRPHRPAIAPPSFALDDERMVPGLCHAQTIHEHVEKLGVRPQ